MRKGKTQTNIGKFDWSDTIDRDNKNTEVWNLESK